MKIAEIDIWNKLPKVAQRIIFVIGSLIAIPLIIMLMAMDIPNILPIFYGETVPLFLYIIFAVFIGFMIYGVCFLLWELAKTVIK